MNRILSVVLALVLCLPLFACGKQPPEAPTQPTEAPTEAPTAAPAAPATEPPTEAPTEAPTEPPVPEVGSDNLLFTYTEGQEGPVLTLVGTLPSCGSLPQIGSYYKAIYDDLYATCALNAQEAAQRRAEFVTDGLEFHPWTVEVKSDIVRNDGVTLSVVREIHEQFGGPYPSLSFQAETFDVATQGRLLLGDLFLPEADYLSRLPMAEPDRLNFALTDDAVLLCADGETVSVPLSDLADILKPQYQVK